MLWAPAVKRWGKEFSNSKTWITQIYNIYRYLWHFALGLPLGKHIFPDKWSRYNWKVSIVWCKFHRKKNIPISFNMEIQLPLNWFHLCISIMLVRPMCKHISNQILYSTINLLFQHENWRQITIHMPMKWYFLVNSLNKFVYIEFVLSPIRRNMKKKKPIPVYCNWQRW